LEAWRGVNRGEAVSAVCPIVGDWMESIRKRADCGH
jgi:hypothetical protein